jgi:hypothetical protein
MSFFSPKPAATPTTNTQFMREAPGIEERKIELMDIARGIAQKEIDLPDIQVAGLSGLEQQGMTAAGQTGVGAGTVQQGIASNSRCAASSGVGSCFRTISQLF